MYSRVPSARTRREREAEHGDGIERDQHDQRRPHAAQDQEENVTMGGVFSAQGRVSAALTQGFANQQDDRDEVGEQGAAGERDHRGYRRRAVHRQPWPQICTIQNTAAATSCSEATSEVAKVGLRRGACGRQT